MTIQRILLCGLAGLMMNSTANAQCSRHRPIYTPPTYSPPSYGHHRPHHARDLFYNPHQTAGYHTAGYHTAALPEFAPSPESIQFGGFGHVDQLAARLEVLMNELCLDLYYNYSHNPGFHETYAEAYSLYNTAKFIHASEHNYDRAGIQGSLGGVDALFHHVQDDVRGWTRNPRRQIGTLGIITKISLAEDTLHHLMDDVGVSSLPGREEPPAPIGGPPTALNVPPAPGFLN